MNRGTKILAASVVLGSGTIVALLFRQEPPLSISQESRNYGQLVLRKTPSSLLEDIRTSDHEAPRHDDISEGAPSDPHDVGPATVVTPVESGESSPSLPKDYPGAAPSENARWGTPIGLPFPGGHIARVSKRTHTVIDGDTLRSLAKRYLGSADRHAEIFEANRQLLSNPELLPIGAKLKIPGNNRRASGS
jgi:nucleoid-associated protein YgaU